ncbi:collagen alpha-1(I) chain-like [Myotis myotis]|uniref:collagen alpha-1(I) chain-like n=1 Tax=Myotis myotis TaxID=51298 RepID=UPI001748BD07|nr:collagen alpha-1(I) chain-like [Myotis myotis]
MDIRLLADEKPWASQGPSQEDPGGNGSPSASLGTSAKEPAPLAASPDPAPDHPWVTACQAHRQKAQPCVLTTNKRLQEGSHHSEIASREPRWGPRDSRRISLDTALDPGADGAGAGAGAPRLGQFLSGQFRLKKVGVTSPTCSGCGGVRGDPAGAWAWVQNRGLHRGAGRPPAGVGPGRAGGIADARDSRPGRTGRKPAAGRGAYLWPGARRRAGSGRATPWRGGSGGGTSPEGNGLPAGGAGAWLRPGGRDGGARPAERGSGGAGGPVTGAGGTERRRGRGGRRDARPAPHTEAPPSPGPGPSLSDAGLALPVKHHPRPPLAQNPAPPPLTPASRLEAQPPAGPPSRAGPRPERGRRTSAGSLPGVRPPECVIREQPGSPRGPRAWGSGKEVGGKP